MSNLSSNFNTAILFSSQRFCGKIDHLIYRHFVYEKHHKDNFHRIYHFPMITVISLETKKSNNYLFFVIARYEFLRWNFAIESELEQISTLAGRIDCQSQRNHYKTYAFFSRSRN